MHPRFTTLYLHKSIHKPTKNFWWNLSPTSFIIVRVQIATNCVLMCFWIALWTIWFGAIPNVLLFSIVCFPYLFAFFFNFLYNYLIHSFFPFVCFVNKHNNESKLCKHMDFWIKLGRGWISCGISRLYLMAILRSL